MTTQNFDSKSEELAAPIFSGLGAVRRDDILPVLFTDDNGKEFRARADFYHPQTDTYLEYKDGRLNSIKSLSSSQNRLETQIKWRRVTSPTRKDQLDFGWNHSLYKQLLVQEGLGFLNFAVIFKAPPTDSDAKRYAKRGLVFCTLKSFRNFSAFVRFRKLGLNISFTLHCDNYTITIH